MTTKEFYRAFLDRKVDPFEAAILSGGHWNIQTCGYPREGYLVVRNCPSVAKVKKLGIKHYEDCL